MSRMGEKRISDGRAFYELKDSGSSQRDQRQTIELLTKEAWLNQEDPARAGQLAANLEHLDADQRDELISELNRLGEDSEGLVSRSSEMLAEDYQDLLVRTNAITQSHDIEALLALESEFSEDQNDRFWQAADTVGEEVDSFVDTMEQLQHREKLLVLESIGSLSDLVDQGELERDDAKALAIEFVDLVAEVSRQ